LSTSQLNLGEKIARQTLVEPPAYTACDDDLDLSFFPNGGPTASPTPAAQRTFRSQYLIWMNELKNRAYDPVAPSTLATFTSCAKTILSVVGPSTPLENFKNAAMARFVQDVRKFEWAPSTLAQHILVIKLIIASAVSEEGELLFERNWSRKIINAARVEPSKQKTPRLTKEDVEQLMRKAATYQEKVFYAFLCGSGLRASEAQAVRANGNDSQTSWDREKSTITVRTGCFRNRETGRTKTSAGQRTVFLHSELSQTLIAFAEREKREPGSFLFQSKRGSPIRLSTIREHMAKLIPGAAPHAARRFRTTHLRHERVLEEIIRTQLGHSSNTITDRYSQQDETVCRAAIEAAGLGFQIGEKD
jgi:integrase